MNFREYLNEKQNYSKDKLVKDFAKLMKGFGSYPEGTKVMDGIKDFAKKNKMNLESEDSIHNWSEVQGNQELNIVLSKEEKKIIKYIVIDMYISSNEVGKLSANLDVRDENDETIFTSKI